MARSPSIAVWLEKLKYGWFVDRIVEGSHAGVHRWSSVAPNHTAACDRSGARLVGLKQDIANDAHCIETFAHHILRGRNARMAIQTLGVGKLGTVINAAMKERHNWHPIYANMIYRGHPSTDFNARRAVATSTWIVAEYFEGVAGTGSRAIRDPIGEIRRASKGVRGPGGGASKRCLHPRDQCGPANRSG